MQEKKKEKFLARIKKLDYKIKDNIEIMDELNDILHMDKEIKKENVSVEHFQNKYPQFKKEVHELLSKCAIIQTYDYREQYAFKIKKGNYIIEYN